MTWSREDLRSYDHFSFLILEELLHREAQVHHHYWKTFLEITPFSPGSESIAIIIVLLLLHLLCYEVIIAVKTNKQKNPNEAGRIWERNVRMFKNLKDFLGKLPYLPFFFFNGRGEKLNDVLHHRLIFGSISVRMFFFCVG